MRNSSTREKGQKQISGGLTFLIIAGILWLTLEVSDGDALRYIFDIDYRTSMDLLEYGVWFFGILGFVCLCVGIVNMEAAKSNDEENKKLRTKCPHCNKEILKKSEYCSSCGEKINKNTTVAEKDKAFGGNNKARTDTTYVKADDKHAPDMEECVFCGCMMTEDRPIAVTAKEDVTEEDLYGL